MFRTILFLFATIIYGLFLEQILHIHSVTDLSAGFSAIFIIEMLILHGLYIGVVVYFIRKHGISFLRSNDLFLSMIITMILYIMLGTVILQDTTEADFIKAYPWLSSIFYALGWDHIFTSYGFISILFLFNVSLLVAILHHLSFKMTNRKLALVLVHASLIVISFGAWMGYSLGEKGFIELHVGEQTCQYFAFSGHPKQMVQRGLPFTVQLDNFQIESYPAEWRIYGISQRGEISVVVDPDSTRSFTLDQATIKILDYKKIHNVAYSGKPSVLPTSVFCAHFEVIDSDTAGKPAESMNGTQQPIWLFNDPVDLQTYVTEDRGLQLILIQAIDEIETWSNQSPHWLEFKGQQVSVSVGQSVSLGEDTTLSVIQYFPDFSYDLTTSQSKNVSQEPINPALQVEITVKDQPPFKTWLFSEKTSPMDMQHESLPFPITYVFQDWLRISSQILFYSVSDSQMYQLDSSTKRADPITKQTGTTASETFYIVNKPQGGSYRIAVGEIFPSCQMESQIIEATDDHQAYLPFLQLEIDYGDDQPTKNQILSPMDEPSMIQVNQAQLMLQSKKEEPKNYYSLVSFMKNEQVDLQTVVLVNQPGTFMGYRLYQTNFKEEDPTYSGFEVVYDPGIPFIYAGLVLLILGVISALAFTKKE